MFKRVLIANRGEIAVRIMRACRELGLATVAVYSEADGRALHVRMADSAVLIGPPPAAQSYLCGERIIEAALATGVEAIHPGYGFLSENANFARMCRAAGLVFVGPPPEAIEAMGGKIGARQLAVAAGVPVAPGYNGADQRGATLLAEAERIGYPLLIKASAGGGGKGMRVVRQPDGFAAALEGAQREARAAFGDATVFIEKLIERPRHVEIQIFGDTHGTVLHLGERECSIQRRHQKVLEEAPSPALTPALREEMGQAAVRAARAAGYVNAGTVEFVLDPQGRYYFLEMNTRLQVEHPVTELVTGLDLVHLQFAIAAGQPLPFTQEQVSVRGHAIEVRVYAEDPATYLPAIGRLALHEPPTGPGVRVDSGLTTGDEVTVHYDPMIAKLIVSGSDRPTAIARLREALDDYAVLGLTTNIPLLRALAAHPAYRAGDTHTGFLAEHLLAVAPPQTVPAEVIIAGAILLRGGGAAERAEGSRRLQPDPFAFAWRAGGLNIPLRLHIGTEEYRIALSQQGSDRVMVTWAEQAWQVWQRTLQPNLLAFELAEPQSPAASRRAAIVRYARDPASNDLLLAYRGNAYHIVRPAALSVDSVGQSGASQGGASLTAPMPGTLVKLMVQEGDAVSEGQPLLVLEAMKMEHTIVAPYAGVVRKLPFAQGASVAGGVDLVELEPVKG
jgi:3-methylcrotonyl-CoA carboxylase alpha subunit